MNRSLAVVIVGGFGLSFLLATLNACDSQASNEYRGESLLTLQGSVEIGETSIEGDLIPALAFSKGNESIEILDVSVNGEFPSGFTLDVFDPPPAEVIGDFTGLHDGPGLPGEPRGTWGYITAVSPNHGSSFPVSNAMQVSGNTGGAAANEGGGGVGGVEAMTHDKCFLVAEWCTPSGANCRREHHTCPRDACFRSWNEGDSFEGCTLTGTEGDPDLKVALFDRFAGMSENYTVLYLEDEAPAGSWVAHAFSDDGAIPAGYSLIEVTVIDDVEESQGRDLLREECESLAEDTAIQRIFEAHNGSVPREQIEECDWLRYEENPPAFCADFTLQEQRALAERDCPFDDAVMRRVHDPANTPINVRIGQNLGFGGGEQ